MSSLVNEFLISPVLRQARRFSRNSLHSEQVDPVTNQQRHNPNSAHDGEGNLEVHGGTSQNEAREDGEGAINPMTDRPLVASPVDEGGGLEAQLSAGSSRGPSSTSRTTERSQTLPLRLSSMRSDRVSIDEDMSDNPSFTSQERFRNESPMSSSVSSTPGNSRMDNPELPSRRNTQDRRSGSGSRLRNSSLPEDDGMREMRRKIVEIQSMDIDTGQKAKMMHQLLTEEYQISQKSLHARPARVPSPSSFISQERPSTPGSLNSFGFWQSNEIVPESSSTSTIPTTFQLFPEDLRPTFTPIKPRVLKESEESETGNGSNNLEESVELEPSLGCQHYKRNVKLQCSACTKWYTCRFCHDAVEDHILNRKETKHMLCMLCGFAQMAGEVCVNCDARSAWYYCNTCHLWDDDVTKSIYHCDDCGICRVGAGLGKDYIHCNVSQEIYVCCIVLD